MARRESQGLQIGLIVFVMLTIILMVTSIVLWNKSKHLTAENTKLLDENNKSKAAQTTAIEETMKLKVYLGHTAQTSMDDVTAQYDRDMKTYAQSAPEVQRNYKEVPSLLFVALQDRNKQLNELREQLRQAQEEFEKTRQQLQVAADEAKKMQAAKESELLATRQEFAAYREQLNQQKDEQAAEIEKSRTQLAETRTKTDQQVQVLQRDVKNNRNIIDRLSRQIDDLQGASFDVPDGKITWVNPRTGMAFINLGSADGMRSQVSFSVFGADVNKLAVKEKKGAIEVTRVINDHLSEARITEDGKREPILTGDVVYSPLWNAKSAMHFALTGRMDIDDDGRDDREVVRRLIQINHGKIDAEDKNGEVVGTISNDTRYLIRGREPNVGDVGDGKAEDAQRAWTSLINQSQALGVEELSLQELLDFIGYDGERRTIPLASGDRTQDEAPTTTKPTAPAEPPSDVSTGGEVDDFTERTPPAEAGESNAEATDDADVFGPESDAEATAE